MITGDSHIELSLKRILGLDDLGTRFYNYLGEGIRYDSARVFPKAGFFAACAMAGSGADAFTLTSNTEAADGNGHYLKTLSSLVTAIKFENAVGIAYYVGLRWAEVPSGVVVNPRTAWPEFQARTNTLGDSASPTNVGLDMGGGMRMTVNSVSEASRTFAGRQCMVWKNVPGQLATVASVAIETCLVQFDGVNNFIVTAGTFGQTTPSTNGSDYTVCMLGPTVRRGTDLRLSANTAFVGIVTGAGAGVTPSAFNTTDQVLLLANLSALTDVLRVGPGGHLKVRVKSYTGDGTTPQIEVDNESGVLKFSVDKDGNVQINGNLDVAGTTTEHNVETVYSDETITGNLTAGDAAGDLHTIRGTWRHLYSTSSIAFQIDGTTGNVGLKVAPHATDPISAGGHVVPASNNLFDLGDPARVWANLYVSNITISGDFLPLTDITQDIGSDAKRWEEVHARYWLNFGGRAFLTNTGGLAVGWAASPLALLHVGNTVASGYQRGLLVGQVGVADTACNMIENIGNRNDGGLFYGGRLGLSHWRSDGSAMGAQTNLGAVWFGGMHTGGAWTRGNHLYSAAIVARANEAWSGAGNLGSYLEFRVAPNATLSQGQDLFATAALPGTSVLSIMQYGLLPSSNNAFDLGYPTTNEWRNVYLCGHERHNYVAGAVESWVMGAGNSLVVRPIATSVQWYTDHTGTPTIFNVTKDGRFTFGVGAADSAYATMLVIAGWLGEINWGNVSHSGRALGRLSSHDTYGVGMSYNIYYDGASWRRVIAGYTAGYSQNNGTHYWDTGDNGAADATYTSTTKMVLSNAGYLGINTASPYALLDVKTATNLHIGMRPNTTWNELFAANDLANAYVQMSINANPLYINHASNANTCFKGVDAASTVCLASGSLSLGGNSANVLNSNSSLEIATNIGVYGGVNDGHTGYRIGVGNMAGWTTAQLFFQCSNSWMSYDAANPVCVMGYSWTTIRRMLAINSTTEMYMLRQPGANSTSWMVARGTGTFTVGTVDAANFEIQTNGLFHWRFGSDTTLYTEGGIEVGALGSGSRYALIDFVGDTTYTDFGLRIGRYNTGANTTSEIQHRGTGQFNISTNDAADMYFSTGGAGRLRLRSGGQIQTGGSAATVDCAGAGGLTVWPGGTGYAITCKLTSLNTTFNTPHWDTYAHLSYYNSGTTGGGLSLEGYAGTSISVGLYLYGGSADASPDGTTGTAAYGTVTVAGQNANGIASSNLFVVRDTAGGAHMIVKWNGAMYLDTTGVVGITGGFDDEKDAVACRDLSYVVADQARLVLEYNRDRFERLGILENGFLNVQKTDMLVLGAIGELHLVIEHLANMLGLEYDDVRQLVRAKQAAHAAQE